MEVLHAETNEYPRVRNTNASPSSSRASSPVDDDDDDDCCSEGSHRVHSRDASPADQAKKTPGNSRKASSPAHSRPMPSHDYLRQREHLAKEMKDYEDRWLAHRNFLLYTQSFGMKPEDRERLFTQMNPTANRGEDNAPLNQLQIQQQLFHHLSKDERDRVLAAAFYQQQHQQQQQQQQQRNALNFHAFPWAAHGAPNLAVQNQPAAEHAPPKSPGSDDSGTQSNSGSTAEWTFEEQFRQLYELSDEPKRKEFLDDLFAFMQKRGTPVNRIPIMAKHVLDLYELFRLVVGKGGLVEVINKKLWREVTKGLNLPSSITSAAFTLRTQYMKYLYPFECEKLQLSAPSELQAAIEGNRREGRRPSYAFEYSSPPQIMAPPPPPPPPPTTTTAAVAAAANNAFLTSPLGHRPLDSNHAAMAAALSHPFFLAAAAAASSREVTESPSSTPRMSSFDEHHHFNTAIKRSSSPCFPSARAHDDSPKRFAPTTNSPVPLASKLRILSKDHHPEQQATEKSIHFSMELNGIAYQGVLYATALTSGKE